MFHGLKHLEDCPSVRGGTTKQIEDSAEPMREATTRDVVLWRCKGWRILVRHEGKGRNGGIMRFPLRGNGVIITRYHAAA